MLIAKIDPQGVDIPIHLLQATLHEQLLAKWNISNDQYKCYPRCYRNKQPGGIYRAENFEGGKDYRSAYWDDTLSVVSFFGLASTEKHGMTEKVSVHLIFFVDLKKLKPAINHRADEEVRKDVQLIAEQNMYGFTYQSTEMWSENVLREYVGSARELESKIDMHPVHCFRINFDLYYNKNICLQPGATL